MATTNDRRTKVLREVGVRDPLRPERKQSEDPAVAPSGEPILRFFTNQGDRNAIYAPSEVSPAYCQAFASETSLAASQGKPARALAMLFDLEMPQIPSVDQQYAIVESYVRHHPRVLWDGWSDTAIQYVRPEMSYSTIGGMPIVEYAMHYAFHASHLVIPSLAFLSSRTDYERLSLLAAGVGKTIAFLDAAIDTLKTPEQLSALAATSRGKVTSSLSGILGSRLVRSSNGIGWLMEATTQTAVPDMAVRKACEQLAADLTRLMDNQSVIRPGELLTRIFPVGKYANASQPALTLSCLYLAHRLGYPRGLNLAVARSICTFAKLNVAAGDKFDLDKAKSVYDEIDRRIGESHAALLHAKSKRYAAEIARILRERYAPTINAPWIVEGMRQAPSPVIALRELPPWLRETDELEAASTILKSIGAKHLREDEELVAAIARILCEATSRLEDADASGAKPKAMPTKVGKRSALDKGGLSSTEPTGTPTACPPTENCQCTGPATPSS